MKRLSKTAYTYLGAAIRRQGKGWRVLLPRVRGAGRLRKYCSNLDDCRIWVDENLSRRAPDFSMPTPAEITELRAARSLLPDGYTLTDAARHYAAALAAAPRLAASPPVADAVAEYLKAKREAGMRPKTIEGYSYALRKLPHDGKVSEIRRSDLHEVLAILGARDRDNVRRTWVTWFGWAVRKGYAVQTPLEAVERVRRDPQPPKIYTPETLEAVLHHAEKKAPRLIPLIALGAFAGIRTAGLLRLKDGDIDIDKAMIWIPGYADKLRAGYSAPMESNLQSWLRRYPFKPMPVTPSYFCNRILELFTAAGEQTVQNGLRHSFASYKLAACDDAALVAARLGQYGGVQTLLNNYRRATTPAEALKWFSICPASVQRHPKKRKK